MGVGFDFFDRIAPELFADHFKFFVQARGLEDRVGFQFLHEGHQTQTHRLGVALLGQPGGSAGGEQGRDVRAEAHIL